MHHDFMNHRFRTRTTVFLLLAAFVVVAGVVLTACSPDKSSSTGEAKDKTFYTCGMHPQVVQDHPGNCPICGMKLTPIRSDESKETNRSIIAIDPATTQTMGIRTATVHRGPLRKKIRLVGTIDYNEMTLTDVTTKFKGWIEKLYVNTTGQLVMRGDPLFEIYSPELYSAQQEYLVATRQPTN